MYRSSDSTRQKPVIFTLEKSDYRLGTSASWGNGLKLRLALGVLKKTMAMNLPRRRCHSWKLSTKTIKLEQPAPMPIFDDWNDEMIYYETRSDRRLATI